jgi:hypothetical protein
MEIKNLHGDFQPLADMERSVSRYRYYMRQKSEKFHRGQQFADLDFSIRFYGNHKTTKIITDYSFMSAPISLPLD